MPGTRPFADLPAAAEVLRRHPGDDPYARRLRRLAQEAKKRRSGRIHTPYDEQEILATPRGTRTKFLNDRAIGNEASGLTQVMIQFAPGKTQSLHRHPGEAWLYVVEGHGHSFLGTAPDKGEHHRWKKGDLIVVDHFLWHQHFNDDPVNQCRLVRIHMFDSILETMRALMDPMVLFEEAEDTLRLDAGAVADPVARRQAAGRVMDRTRAALAPGVLSMHVLPAEHHDRDWDAIIVPREVKERLLAQALLVLQHGRKLRCCRDCRTGSSCSPARRAPARPRWRAASRRSRRSRSRAKAPPRSSRSTRTRSRATCWARASAT